MADPTMPAPSGDPNQDQNNLIMAQFAAARKNLNQQNQVGQQNLNDQLNRTQAMTGLSGGAALKAKSDIQTQFDQQASANQAGLDTAQAQALQQVAAQKAQNQFQQGLQQESEGFQAGQSALDRAQQQTQFEASYGLQKDQLAEQKNEFSQQMGYQWTEFNENTQTNLINAAIAAKKGGIDNPAALAKSLTSVLQIQSVAGGTPIPQAPTQIPLGISPNNPGLNYFGGVPPNNPSTAMM